MVRVTRKEAAAKLNVSKSTLDRMVKRGELITETDQHGHRHTVWVLMDDPSLKTPMKTPLGTRMVTSLHPVSTQGATSGQRTSPSKPR